LVLYGAFALEWHTQQFFSSIDTIVIFNKVVSVEAVKVILVVSHISGYNASVLS
jgi:hypothetical protein